VLLVRSQNWYLGLGTLPCCLVHGALLLFFHVYMERIIICPIGLIDNDGS